MNVSLSLPLFAIIQNIVSFLESDSLEPTFKNITMCVC